MLMEKVVGFGKVSIELTERRGTRVAGKDYKDYSGSQTETGKGVDEWFVYHF